MRSTHLSATVVALFPNEVGLLAELDEETMKHWQAQPLSEPDQG